MACVSKEANQIASSRSCNLQAGSVMKHIQVRFAQLASNFDLAVSFQTMKKKKKNAFIRSCHLDPEAHIKT